MLDAIGDQARYIGPIGSATVAKLVHNMSGYAIVCALAETFAMGVKAGVEPLALWEAVRQGAAGRRYTFDALINQWLPGKYDPPDFALKLAHKDVGLATALGRELGLPMRICELAYAEMTEAMNRGWAGRDSRVVMMLEQERAGIEVKVDPERLKEALALPFPATQAAERNSENAMASSKLLLRGGQVYDHDGDVHKPAIADILIENGDIAAVGAEPGRPAVRTRSSTRAASSSCRA